jgi:hypothetical protein
MSLRFSSFFLVGCLAVACGGASSAPPEAAPQPETTAPESPAPTTEADAGTAPAPSDAGSTETAPTTQETPSAGAVPWAKQDRKQRLDTMAKVVMPEMKKLFQSYDATGFASFNCKTCHGEDLQKVDFKMPNSVHPLPTKDTWAAAIKEDEKMANFMKDKVQPTMAKLLGVDLYSPSTPNGFGCFNCHKKAD